jgi:hypothetical protein
VCMYECCCTSVVTQILSVSEDYGTAVAVCLSFRTKSHFEPTIIGMHVLVRYCSTMVIVMSTSQHDIMHFDVTHMP